FSVLFFTASSALAQPPGDTQPLREAAYSPAQAPAQSTADSDYRLGSGDKVRISVFNQRELTDIYQVDGLGHIAFPLVGQIDAGGLTPRQLEEKVAKVLSPDYVRNPHVSVVVLTYRPFYIIGEVTKPGSYPYMSGMTVLTAAAQAGGFTYRADEDSFDLQRPGADGKKKKIDAKPDTPVQPGDIITVNERIF
ncbi:MAG: polysaccharide export protein, partial [Alphaproteobacteria bacterium]|nr:polysaccharide export protein [Alphaproteobacteria bacterium]